MCLEKNAAHPLRYFRQRKGMVVLKPELRNNAAENLAILRRLTMNMLRAERSTGSIATKQKRTWMKTSYLEKVLIAEFNTIGK